MRRRRRFAGAGASAEREFNRLRRKNIRDSWWVWGLMAAGTAGFATWSAFTGEVAGRLLAAMAGMIVGAATVVWSLGGHISAFRWWLGAEGERDTAKRIERLGPEWHCEHDVEHEYGNFDHVLVGPPGVFLIDSKLLHTTAVAGDDRLRAGRIFYGGAAFRGGARRIKLALEQRLGSKAPWVQAMVVVWGDFPQARHAEGDVVYLRGEELVPWLNEQAERLNAPQRAALVTALQEVRAALSEHVRVR